MLFRLIPTVIGLLLVASAALKLHALAGGGAQFAWLSLDLAAVGFELALGIGLMVARGGRGGLWLVAVATFVGFLAYNLRGVWVGQASCGCFGAVEVRPGLAAGLDAGVLALLGLWAVFDPRVRPSKGAGRQASGFLLGYGLALVGWALPVFLVFGSVESAVAAARGDELFFTPTVLDLGSQPAGTAVERTLTVRTRGDRPVRLIGGTSNCGCTLLEDLPAVVPPGGSCSIRVRVTVPHEAGSFGVQAVLWTDSQTNDALPVHIRGRSVGP